MVMQAQSIADLELPAFGRALRDNQERSAKHWETINTLMGGSVTGSADLIQLHFKLAVLELGLGTFDKMMALSHFPGMVEAAKQGTYRDLATCARYGWLLGVYMAEHFQQPDELLTQTLYACAKDLFEFAHTTSDPKARMMAQLPRQAFGLIASMETIREQPRSKEAQGLLLNVQKAAARLDEETNNDFGFAAWVQRRRKQLGV